MGRRKKLTDAELENTQTTLTIEDSNQAESEEAELLAETDSEVIAEAAIEEEPKAEEPAKPRKPRKPRAKKVEAAVVSDEKEEVTIPEPTPSPASLDQWAAIKQLSDSVAQVLERTRQIQAPPPSLDFDTNEFLRPQQPAPHTLFITKFATAASIVALLISIVSLSLSQSARQAALIALEPLKQSNLGIAAKPSPIEETSQLKRTFRRNR